ncbi:hypothetical protein [Roseateles koreensis]|uniref:Solute-binding protein family 3/N-terminal domain-containing protein n=1 Tax=Roseateles koreensis TaxID=2987526 RepID=A0ABT5KUU7_9BURK|nr:hypothetical protein [Roseateles koreensis]MDC8785557.1 hypothetical protein [Roseateles koreensis]
MSRLPALVLRTGYARSLHLSGQAALRALGVAGLLLGLSLAPPAAAADSEKAANATNTDTLHWFVQDIPPHFSYVTGKPPQSVKDLGHGEIDGFLRLLIERMPQSRHDFVDGSFPRFEALARQGKPLCSMLYLRTPERLSWLYFTYLYPAQFSRQIHVIVRRDKLAQFAQLNAPDQMLSLTDILHRTDLVGLVPKGRSFGPKIDALLLAQSDLAPKALPTGRGNHLLAMLRAQRMDYTLEYPSVVDEFVKNDEAGAELVPLPISEGRSTAIATASCTRSPEGLKAISAIDAAVRKLAQDPQRDVWIRAWRGPHLDEQDRANIKRYMDERARSGPQIE